MTERCIAIHPRGEIPPKHPCEGPVIKRVVKGNLFVSLFGSMPVPEKVKEAVMFACDWHFKELVNAVKENRVDFVERPGGVP